MFSEPSPSPADLVKLASVTITPIDSRQPVARTCDRFVAIANNAVMLVPDADPKRLPYWGSYKCYTDPYKGTFYVGPYVVRGTLMGFPTGRLDETFVGVDLHVSTLSRVRLRAVRRTVRSRELPSRARMGSGVVVRARRGRNRG